MAADPRRFHLETEAIATILDQLDYFQVLKLPHDATPTQVRAAFHTESRHYHPDRYFHLDDEELKSRVHRIYKRITEAYAVLRDEATKARYLSDIVGPDREAKLRYTEASEWERKKAREEEVGTTPNGRRFHAAGMVDLASGRADAALRNFKAALMYEPQNLLYREKVEEAQRLLDVRETG